MCHTFNGYPVREGEHRYFVPVIHLLGLLLIISAPQWRIAPTNGWSLAGSFVSFQVPLDSRGSQPSLVP